MKAEIVSINKVRSNPNNPRIIKDDKFQKLVKSIQEFPQMLEIRPIVVNEDMIVLGGNMRLKACLEAGLKEIPIIKASNLTEEQQKEFIIKDNVGFGEHDWDIIANEWDTELLEDWGLDVGGFEVNSDELGTDFTLPDGDKAPFQQMTFTLADEQAEILKAELEKVKKSEEFKYVETFGNENSNGNALYLLIMNKKK